MCPCPRKYNQVPVFRCTFRRWPHDASSRLMGVPVLKRPKKNYNNSLPMNTPNNQQASKHSLNGPTGRWGARAVPPSPPPPSPEAETCINVDDHLGLRTSVSPLVCSVAGHRRPCSRPTWPELKFRGVSVQTFHHNSAQTTHTFYLCSPTLAGFRPLAWL